jgi:hypothetical protein
VLFALVILFGVQEMRRDEQRKILQERWKILNQDVHNLHKDILSLEDDLASSSDPLWIENNMIEILGVIPEKQKKLYLKRPPNDRTLYSCH